MMYCRVIPFSKTFDTKGLLYFIPKHLTENIKLYQIVQVPLKDTIEISVVVDIYQEIPGDISPDKIKSLVDIYDENIYLFDYQKHIIDFIAYTYITPIHNSLGIFFPRNLREKILKQTISKVVPQEYSYTNTTSLILSTQQERVFQEIQNAEKKEILLYGITGSGKTEIYQKLIAKNLELGLQTLLLIPEIILGSQIGERVQSFFGQDVLILSSEVSEAKRTQYWKDVASGNAKIIVGTRSSLFYPYKNLGMIIVDEEHDPSYISDSAPRYKTGDIVHEISSFLDIPVLYASGTPSVQTMYNAMQGKLELVTLLEKYSGD